EARNLRLRGERLKKLARTHSLPPPVAVADLLRLAPSLQPFAELPARLGFLLDHPGKGLTWVGTYGPLERLEEGGRAGARLLEEAGHPPLVVARPMKGGHFAVLRFIERFDRSDPGQVRRVRELNVAVARALLELDYVPYKCPEPLLDEVLRRMDPGFVDLMRRVKSVVDPKGVLSPSRWRLGAPRSERVNP
ncbi:MAG: hypothetical protein ACE5JG_10640, partial [Planctomycetota bacterium]